MTAARNVLKFTWKFVENPKPEAERYRIWEANAHGRGTLGLRVAPTGKLSWGYPHRHDGASKTMTRGRHPPRAERFRRWR